MLTNCVKRDVSWSFEGCNQTFKGYKLLLTFVYALETTHLYISSKIEGFSYEGWCGTVHVQQTFEKST